MNFRTELNIPPSDFQISHSHKIAGMGSCFVDNIGKKLENAKFQYLKNPFGTIFHPIAMENALARIHSRTYYSENEIFNYEELYFSWDHHSSFNSSKLKTTLEKINYSLEQANRFLHQTDFFLLTFGTAWVYKIKGVDLMVANCHKVPAKHFEKILLNNNQLKQSFRNCFEIIYDINPHAKILTTISPVRHTKDGIIENNISKARLISNLFDVAQNYRNVYYFPAYELLLDDLRDYRFYGDDLIHPSQMAIEYIWDKFSDTYFSEETKELIGKVEKVQNALNHHPFNPGTLSHKKFLYSTYKKIEEIEPQFPQDTFNPEKESLKNQMENDH